MCVELQAAELLDTLTKPCMFYMCVCFTHRLKHYYSLKSQAWPELPFLELVLQGRNGASWEI